MKNKLLNFVLDLIRDSDDEEQDSIFAQVKIYRTTSVRVFEYIIGILLLALWLLTIEHIIHTMAEEWHTYLIIAGTEQSASVSVFDTLITRRLTICRSLKSSTPDRYTSCRFVAACSLSFMHSSLYGAVVQNG